MADREYERIVLTGVVQGVGFRPYVCRVARQMEIEGYVLNAGGVVHVFAKASSAMLDAFVATITNPVLPGAIVVHVTREHVEAFQTQGFTIAESEAAAAASMILTVDLPLCESCASELLTETNRRYHHPLISCASCGPRFTILTDMPYDRHHTAMLDFPMCASCRLEYTAVENHRFHAQTISCYECGPQLTFVTHTKVYDGDTAIEEAAHQLQTGGLVAMKGIGGYHIACSPFDSEAVNRLRTLKGRDAKPFAVLFPSVESIKALCAVTPHEIALLTSEARPIVLLDTECPAFVPQVCNGSLQTGCLLAYTPLQLLLLSQTGPLILTSLNVAESPIITSDADALAFKGLDGVLTHPRQIVTPLDDSVVQVFEQDTSVVRRSRGYVPKAIAMRTPETLLAMGGDLKAAFCVVTGGQACLSAPFGDLAHTSVQDIFEAELARFSALIGCYPTVIACDTHPRYHSAKMARKLGKRIIEVQHHHAHIGAVMAEHTLVSPLIGVAFDGTGYGTDGTIWGGEIFIVEQSTFTRFAHLPKVKLQGGDLSAKDARKTLDCYLHGAGLSAYTTQGDLLHKALLHDIHTAVSTSAGRMFDAVASLLDICHVNQYEGQCAIALQNVATIAYRNGITSPLLHIETLWSELVEIQQQDTASVALAFHHALARWILESCLGARQQYGITDVALGGGVFQNTLLLRLTIDALRANGFQVYYNKQFSSGDGSLALGQAYLVSAMLERDR